MADLMSFFANIDWYEIWLATGDTMLMLGGSLLFTVLLVCRWACCCFSAARVSCWRTVASTPCCRWW
jgi:hypothetical protein